jgi:hypothetical protein
MLNDDGKLRRKYSNKRVNSAREGIEFKLSFDELCLLMKEAGIVLSNWGFTGGYYVLARFNDEGPYEYGNCRFITQYENMKEQKTTISQTVARRANIKKAFDSSNRQEGYDNYLKMRRKLSEERNRRRIRDDMDHRWIH